MEVAQPPLSVVRGTENKRHCIRIKARIRVSGEAQPAVQAKRPYQAYCETIASSRSQSPDIFSIHPSQRDSVYPIEPSTALTITARISPRKETISNASFSQSSGSCPKQHDFPIVLPRSVDRSNKQDVSTNRIPSNTATVPTSQYHTVSQPTTPRGSHLRATTEYMSRNRALSLPQLQQASPVPKPSSQIILAKTPLRQKRYGRMEFHPLPPLPSSTPEAPAGSATAGSATDRRYSGQTTVNFSRGEIKRIYTKAQEQATAPHLACVDTDTPPLLLPALIQHHAQVSPLHTTAGFERPQSKASRRTVAFTDDVTLSSRSSSSDDHSQYFTPNLPQSKSFSSEAQVPSSLRFYNSQDNTLVASSSAQAFRRTMPKDFKHKYTFGQRPASRMSATPGLGRSDQHYNPRLSTSKAEYRSLQTLPPLPPPKPLGPAEPQPGPRQPPWGGLEDLEERREKRGDARERDEAYKFRRATLSQQSTAGSTDSFGTEKMKREVEEYKEQVMSVYPDMAFDGNAGKGGRSCCCAVM